jgi:hypothetical protein
MTNDQGPMMKKENMWAKNRVSVLCLVCCAFIVFALSGCGSDPIENPFPDDSTEYFPLAVGRSITYAVDSTVFDDAPNGNSFETVSFQIKEEIASVNLDLEGDSVYYLHRYRRSTDIDPWVITDVWTLEKNTAEALRTEENITFRKLNFPLRFGKRWNPTSYIHPETTVQIGTEFMEPFQDWDAEVLSFDKPGNVGDFEFANNEVMIVQQADTDDGVMKRYVLETYVRNIGLVERRDSILDSRCIAIGDFGPCIGKEWIEHASKGYILSQVMIAYE